MKLLLLTDEAWNDKLHASNVFTNWFSGMDIEIANIYRASGLPFNHVCKKYFRLSDSRLFQSIINNTDSGEILEYMGCGDEAAALPLVSKDNYLDKMALLLKCNTMRLIRQFLWCSNKWKSRRLTDFVLSFQPDVIFSARYASSSFLKIERYLKQITGKPLIAFSADDDYSLKQISLSPAWWLNRLLTRHAMKKTAPLYALYYTFSKEQAEYYLTEFGCRMDVIYKGGDIDTNVRISKVHDPIRMIYAGRLYCNRWKNLMAIRKAIEAVNYSERHIILDIYTNDHLTKRQIRSLSSKSGVNIKGSVPGDILKRLYKDYDIALHVESFDLINRMKVRYSFSTKIIDCLSSGCAVMAVCPERHTGYSYLKSEDVAICISDKKQILSVIQKIVREPNYIEEYKKKALACGLHNHQIREVQKKMMSDFQKVAGG